MVVVAGFSSQRKPTVLAACWLLSASVQSLACVSGLLRPCFPSREFPSILTPSSCCCFPVGHTEPRLSHSYWPYSISATTLITSQMVIDEASLAALTLLKDSQAYIRGAADRTERSPSKPWTSQGAGARLANYPCSSTLLPFAPPAPSRQISSHHQCWTQTGLPSNPGQATQAWQIYNSMIALSQSIFVPL